MISIKVSREPRCGISRYRVDVDGVPVEGRLHGQSVRILEMLAARSPEPVKYADLEPALGDRFRKSLRLTLAAKISPLRRPLKKLGFAIESIEHLGYRLRSLVR